MKITTPISLWLNRILYFHTCRIRLHIGHTQTFHYETHFQNAISSVMQSLFWNHFGHVTQTYYSELSCSVCQLFCRLIEPQRSKTYNKAHSELYTCNLTRTHAQSYTSMCSFCFKVVLSLELCVPGPAYSYAIWQWIEAGFHHILQTKHFDWAALIGQVSNCKEHWYLEWLD